MEQGYHIPVLLHDSIKGLRIDPSGTYVDVTFGGGGHSRHILEQLESGKLYAFDQDADAEANLILDERFHFIRQNFQFLKNNLRLEGVRQVDGILADLGVSSHQFDEAERGFSTRFEADLDMRMDRDSELTALNVLMDYSKDDLIRVLRQGSDVRGVGRIAEAIINEREKDLKTTEDLKSAVSHLIPERKRSQFLAQIFQAMRIEVNGELEVLESLFKQSIDILRPGGRLVVISYHSIEDRMAKNFIRAGNASGELVKDIYGRAETPFKAINRKVIVPSEEEIRNNPRARSAKLRIAEKL
ncbi:MAG: 16S rRNA (cytosine(1402)-N(4))-methyltransferase RsmH [Flavobacteriales bacterium]|nr:16S rRNA (cytosine(1402)-N(4))-methyltransferase RsmH [Flavobacteriales bacterium]